jgi:hypothetical protein
MYVNLFRIKNVVRVSYKTIGWVKEMGYRKRRFYIDAYTVNSFNRYFIQATVLGLTITLRLWNTKLSNSKSWRLW